MKPPSSNFVVFILYKAVLLVPLSSVFLVLILSRAGQVFLMPLSSEKLVSFFVQGAFCDATIFGFLVLNVSMNRFF